MAKTRSRLPSRGPGGRTRRRASNRPRILRFRWWLLMRSRRFSQATVFILAVAVIGVFVLLRRLAPVSPERAAPPG